MPTGEHQTWPRTCPSTCLGTASTTGAALARLPLACCGLSLGLCGAGSVLLEWARLAAAGQPWLTAALEAFSLAHTIAAAAVWLAFTARSERTSPPGPFPKATQCCSSHQN